MSYYPNNYYGGYQIPNYPQSFNQQYMQSYQQAPSPQQMSVLTGKLVDSIDVAKATEVPLGNYGVFPRADMQEIYIKRWNPDGTTKLDIYRPVVPESKEPGICERLDVVENKIDRLLGALTQPPTAKEV